MGKVEKYEKLNKPGLWFVYSENPASELKRYVYDFAVEFGLPIVVYSGMFKKEIQNAVIDLVKTKCIENAANENERNWLEQEMMEYNNHGFFWHPEELNDYIPNGSFWTNYVFFDEFKILSFTNSFSKIYLIENLSDLWHFNAWGDEQFKRIEENFAESKEKEIELSLVEYGEYWRTNLLKQVGKDDVIMLFRRGGNGYVGAFKAIGRRIFDFEKGEEEILYFEENKPRPVDNFDADVEKYDIYKSRDDGATLCSNLIVKRIAYVPEGVGNPGGVYRRTISRYDSHYAWLLQKRFQKQGQWPEEE